MALHQPSKMRHTVPSASGAACTCRNTAVPHTVLGFPLQANPRRLQPKSPRRQQVAQCLHQQPDYISTGASIPPQPPLPPSSSSCSRGPGDEDPQQPNAAMTLSSLAAALGAGCLHVLCNASAANAAQAAHRPHPLYDMATLVIPPGTEGAGQRQGLLEEVTAQQDWQQAAPGNGGGHVAPPSGGPMQAVKRLLRELFSEVTVLKQQVEDLTPKSEDEDMIIPYEGGSVGPVMRAVAPGKHYKSKTQLSGSITWQVPLFGTTLNDGAQGSGGIHMHTAKPSTSPHMEVLLQSLWSDNKHSLTAKLASDGADMVIGPSLSSSHTHQAQPTTGAAALGSLQLQSLMYRAELLQGQLKCCVASAGGALCNIARRLNPNTGSSGLTGVAQQGHGLAMVVQQGAGAAVTWVAPRRHSHSMASPSASQPSEGPISASIGHFITGAAPEQHTVGQVSLHSQQSGCLSLVLSRTIATSNPTRAPRQQMQGQVQGAPAAPRSPQGSMNSPFRRRTADLTSTGLPGLTELHGQKSEVGCKSGSGEVECSWRIGASGTVTLADLLAVTAWHTQPLKTTSTRQPQAGLMVSEDGSNGHVRPLMQRVGGFNTGLQVTSLPDDHGVSLSLTLAAAGQPSAAKRLRAPIQIGRRTSSMGGTSMGGAVRASRLDAANRASSGEVAQGLTSQSSAGLGSQANQPGRIGTWLNSFTSLCELSAHVPLHDGVWLTPGVVLTRRPNSQPAMYVACGTGWRF